MFENMRTEVLNSSVELSEEVPIPDLIVRADRPNLYLGTLKLNRAPQSELASPICTRFKRTSHEFRFKRARAF